MIQESLGSFYGLSETLLKATPLILAGLAVSLAFRMQLWNIGAEGQLHLGGAIGGLQGGLHCFQVLKDTLYSLSCSLPPPYAEVCGQVSQVF